jgi:N-acetylmuramoyl-L-alanine amidase
MRRRIALAVLVIPFALAVSSGCARRAVPPHPVEGPPLPVRPRPGYDGRIDSLDAVDAGWLAGRRIALDPGHGGRFRGSVGVGGLTEAEVNLGVALELRELLESHGAHVFLTRTEDRDFLSASDSSLRADLAERVRLANQFDPDLFVSIHHNADPTGSHDRNEIQTYYKLGDEGASLDAAASLHRYLRRNLGIEGQRIVPGNYFVLRNSVAPAVLTEASFLTDPDVEARLKQAEKRRLEGEALFLGLAHYFARRAPVIQEFAALTPADGSRDMVFEGIPGPLLRARVAGAFDVAELTVDGDTVSVTRQVDVVEGRPRLPLAGGEHTARLAVRLAGSGAARQRTLRFRMRRFPACLEADPIPARFSAGGLQALRLRLLDEWGEPCLDSLKVRVRSLSVGVAPRETVLAARGGAAWGYFRIGRSAGAGQPRGIGFRAELTAGVRHLAGAPCRGSVEPWVPPASQKPWTGFVLEMPSGQPLREAPGTGEPSADVSWLSRDGFAALAPDSAGRTGVPRLNGYRRWGQDSLGPPRLTAVAGGVLHGRRIALDPDGGGEDHAGMGPSGTRAALYNLEVARALSSFLVAAGAQVRLVRTADVALSDVERVRIAEAFRPDRYLRIGHRAEPPRLGYYYSSVPGREWALRTATELARLGLPAPAPAEDAQYPLQQVSATALYASIARVDEGADEDRMTAPGALRSEAYALYLGLLREWAPQADWPLDSLRVVDAEGRPVAEASVTLGRALVLQTDATGQVRFVRTETGPLEVQVDHPRVQTRSILLDSDRGVQLTGPRGE